MKKVKYLFMKKVKIKEYKREVKENNYNPAAIASLSLGGYSENAESENISIFDDDYYDSDDSKDKKEVCVDDNSMFNDGYYEKSENDKIIIEKSSDNLKQLTFDSTYRVSKREALTSIEAKTPFIVGKNKSKKPKIEEYDAVYKTIPKIKHSDKKGARRVGYLQVSDKVRKQHINIAKSKNVIGIVNDDYCITKKKGFYQRKIGYVKLQDDNSGKDKYVEVTKSKGIEFLLILLILVGIGLLIKNCDLPDEWHFNLKNLSLYKTEKQVEYEEHMLTVHHDASPVMKDGVLELNLVSEKSGDADGDLEYIVKIIDNMSDETIFESEKLKEGEGLQSVPVDKKYEVGEYHCDILCDAYKGLIYLGTVESDMVMIVK